LSRLAHARLDIALGRSDAARQQLNYALGLDPANTEARNALMNMLNGRFIDHVARDDWVAAWDDWSERHRLLVQSPEKGQGNDAHQTIVEESHFYLGEIQWNLGNARAAMEHYQAAHDIHPGLGRTNRGLVQCCLKLGDKAWNGGNLDEALVLFQRADEIQSYLVETREKSLRDKQSLAEVLDRLQCFHAELGHPEAVEKFQRRQRKLDDAIARQLQQAASGETLTSN
jgi:tetratricopeptide (TPR) repeat protein